MYSCETIWVKVLVSKGWVQYKHYNGKNTNRGDGGGIFRCIEEIYSKWILQGLIKNNVENSGHDQEKIMWNFQ